MNLTRIAWLLAPLGSFRRHRRKVKNSWVKVVRKVYKGGVLVRKFSCENNKRSRIERVNIYLWARVFLAAYGQAGMEWGEVR